MQLTDITQGNIKDGVTTLSCGEATFCYLCQTPTDPLVRNPTASNHSLSEPSAAQQPAHPDFGVPMRLHRCRVWWYWCLTASRVWCDYPRKLPMFLITHFLSPGSDRGGTGWYFNAKLWGASTVTPGWNSCVSSQNGEIVNGIKQTRCTVQHVVCKGHSQEWLERKVLGGARALPTSTDIPMAFWTSAPLESPQ